MAYAVTLSLLDYLNAVEVAVARMRQSAQRGHNAANVRQRTWLTRLSTDVCGAAAGLAVARWLGIPWSKSVGTFHREADVGEDIDVRHTERHDGRLVLRRQDHPYRQFVLVTGTPPNMVLQGHCRARGHGPRILVRPQRFRRCLVRPVVQAYPDPPRRQRSALSTPDGGSPGVTRCPVLGLSGPLCYEIASPAPVLPGTGSDGSQRQGHSAQSGVPSCDSKRPQFWGTGF